MAETTLALLQIDENGDGYVQTMELQSALKHVGIDLPGFQIRDLVGRYGGKDRLTFGEFSEVRCRAIQHCPAIKVARFPK